MGIPTALDEFTDAHAKAWNQMKKAIEDLNARVLSDRFTVSGTLPTSVIIDLGAPEVTACARTLALLLDTLQKGGLIKVVLK